MSQFFVNVDQKSALVRGSTVWGRQPFDLETLLVELTPEERGFLQVVDNGSVQVRLPGESYSETLSAVAADPTSVLQAFRLVVTHHARKKAAAVAEAQVKLDAAKADPQSVLRASGGFVWGWGQSEIKGLAMTAGVDAEPYLAALLPVAVATLAEGKAQEEVARKEQEVRDAQRERERDESAQVWLVWATDHGTPELRRAIEEGYPLGQRVENEVLDFLFSRFSLPMCTFRGEVQTSKERTVPKEEAYAAQEALRKLADGLLPGSLPANAVVTIGRVSAVSWYAPCPCGADYACQEHDEDGDITIRRTAVPVSIESAHHKATGWYVLDE